MIRLFIPFCLLSVVAFSQPAKPKVFVFTDINLIGGDPDDRQSFIHLLWYSDELDIVGLVPDYWDGKGVEACEMGVVAYSADYYQYGFEKQGLINPDVLRSRIFGTRELAKSKFKEVVAKNTDPVYVLVWGSMITLKDILLEEPGLADGIRVLSIGTGLKYGPKDEVPGEECDVPNWNGRGRQAIYDHPDLQNLWWLENNWTYNGMFQGDEPTEMFSTLQAYGAMGKHIKEVTHRHPWAQYFRVGDTPTVTYLIDATHDPDDPTTSSWAGKFKRPFPERKPNYFTDNNGDIAWDYAYPCNTWSNLQEMYAYNKSTLHRERPEMYRELIKKLNRLYR